MLNRESYILQLPGAEAICASGWGMIWHGGCIDDLAWDTGRRFRDTGAAPRRSTSKIGDSTTNRVLALYMYYTCNDRMGKNEKAMHACERVREDLGCKVSRLRVYMTLRPIRSLRMRRTPSSSTLSALLSCQNG